MLKIVFFILICCVKIGATELPSEITAILLEEKPFKTALRENNIKQVKYSLDRISNEWQSLKEILIQNKLPIYVQNIDAVISRLNLEFEHNNMAKVGEDNDKLQKYLFDIYFFFDTNTSPEINFFIIYLEQLNHYIKSNSYDYLLEQVSELKIISAYIEKRLEKRGFFTGKIILLFKYFQQILDKTIPAVLDKDIDTVNSNSKELNNLIKNLKSMFQDRYNK